MGSRTRSVFPTAMKPCRRAALRFAQFVGLNADAASAIYSSSPHSERAIGGKRHGHAYEQAYDPARSRGRQWRVRLHCRLLHRSTAQRWKAAGSNSSRSTPAWFSVRFSGQIFLLRLRRSLSDGSIPALPRMRFSVVDVRDIAALQLLAMTTSSAAGQRFIGASEFYWMADMAKILKQGLGDQARKVPNERMRSPEIPIVSVMPAPRFWRTYGRAAKVTQSLIEDLMSYEFM